MKILVADDDRLSRRILEMVLQEWGYDVVLACDGAQAWAHMHGDDAPRLAILDWMMPEMDGLELCGKLRAQPRTRSTYVILLTVKGSKQDIVNGLKGGADDYIAKPFDMEELQARLQVGRRIVDLQESLSDRVCQLEEALASVNQLQGLLPICMYCKKIRDGQDYWQQVEAYIAHRSQARFSHGICPDCCDAVVKPELARFASTLKQK